jgi:hypothetical protein
MCNGEGLTTVVVIGQKNRVLLHGSSSTEAVDEEP